MGCTKKIILICEDELHVAFIRACLRKLDTGRMIDFKRDINNPEVMGSINNVIRRAKDEFAAWKTRNASNKALLIVVADADDKMRDGRRRDFESADGLSFKDLFVVVIPKRNIETWLQLGEDGNPRNTKNIDDEIDYKRVVPQNTHNSPDKTDRTKQSANALCDLYLQNQISSDQNSVWRNFECDMNALKRGIEDLYRRVSS